MKSKKLRKLTDQERKIIIKQRFDIKEETDILEYHVETLNLNITKGYHIQLKENIHAAKHNRNDMLKTIQMNRNIIRELKTQLKEGVPIKEQNGSHS